MHLGKIFSTYMYDVYGVVLTNNNILNRIPNVHLIIIIVLEETNTKGNVVMPPYFDRSK